MGDKREVEAITLLTCKAFDKTLPELLLFIRVLSIARKTVHVLCPVTSKAYVLQALLTFKVHK